MSESVKIMIVDDSRVSRMMIKSKVMEKQPDWVIVEAEDAAQAIELTKNQGKIDFFSVDFNMPGMSGLELLEYLQRDYSTSRMALLTANIQEDTLKKTMKLGVACFHKPITEKVVDDLIGYFNA